MHVDCTKIVLSEEKRKLLDDIILNEVDIEKINKAKSEYKGHPKSWINIMEGIYKLHFKLKYSAREIYNFYDKNIASSETISKWLKIAGWSRNLKEVQAIAVTKRDYGAIKRKRKETMLDRFAENEIEGSRIEVYIRAKIAIDLSRLLPKHEVIVGTNMVMNIVNREIDIPIVIINKRNKVYRFAVEIDGAYYHELRKETDEKKIKDLSNSNWFLIKLANHSSTLRDKEGVITNLKQLNQEIRNVMDIIVNEVHSNNKRKKNVDIECIDNVGSVVDIVNNGYIDYLN